MWEHMPNQEENPELCIPPAPVTTQWRTDDLRGTLSMITKELERESL